MLIHKIVMTAIALLMGIVSAASFRKQAKADTCPVHDRIAGTAAILVAWMSIIAAVCLVIYAWFFIDG